MKKSILSLVTIVLMTACNSKESKSADRSLLQSDWQLEKINGESLEESMTIPTLRINLSEMRLSGNSGCNNYTGAITELDNKIIKIGDMASTLKLCPEANYEDQYMNLLKQVKTFEVNDSSLSFKDGNNNKILEFTKQSGTKNTMRIHDIWSAVRIEGHPINRMVTVPRLEINTKEMKIYGNDGCNDYFGSIEDLTKDAILLGTIGSTRKMCQDMEVPERYMNALNKTKHYKFEENFLLLTDPDDNEILAFMKVD